MTQATANPNLTILGGGQVQFKDDDRYREYRRLWHEVPRSFLLREFPLHLDIESTNRCNLRCTFCDKLPNMAPGDIGDMDLGMYRRIIDEGREHGLFSIKLSYRGECLLHPDLAEMVAYAKAAGVIDIGFNTNGMLLTEAKARALMDAGLDRISISVEGTDPLRYERERRGARFETVRRNIARLRALRESLGAQGFKIRVQTVRLPGLDLAEYARMWGPLADETAAVDYRDASARHEGLEDPDWACPNLWQRVAIEWDGRVTACNFDDGHRLECGRIPQITVHQAWHSRVAQEAREKHRRGLSHEVPACAGCPWRTTEILKRRAAQGGQESGND